MPQLHFLNVGNGDCTWIHHADERNTVIDVCNGNSPGETASAIDSIILETLEKQKGVRGNFRQKSYPVNPIDYLQGFGVIDIFRFVATHPDMDHLDGLKRLFEVFNPDNFWDTDNLKEINQFKGSPYSDTDWKFYKGLRDGSNSCGAKRLTLYSGASGKFYNRGADGSVGGNGLTILAPTEEIINAANERCDYNDCSYVLMYRCGEKKVIIGGDSHDASWEYILKEHLSLVSDIDVLIAPHHGRDSQRSYDFLDALNPKLTLFGVARAEHLGYSAWRNRGLEVLTNNQGGSFVLDFSETFVNVYCTYRTFVEVYCHSSYGFGTHFSRALKSWYLKSL